MAITRILSSVVLPTAALTLALVMIHDQSASAVGVLPAHSRLTASPRPLERPFWSVIRRDISAPVLHQVSNLHDTPIILPRETVQSPAEIQPVALRVDGGIWTR
ncbi:MULTISPECIES: hypothetical protein [Thioclava]|uniref:Secreted protein n=1 Tax=Thioclava kandeliae TaxID=3070818 RepID=A0ABV1SCD4_9RHOB